MLYWFDYSLSFQSGELLGDCWSQCKRHWASLAELGVALSSNSNCTRGPAYPDMSSWNTAEWRCKTACTCGGVFRCCNWFIPRTLMWRAWNQSRPKRLQPDPFITRSGSTKSLDLNLTAAWKRPRSFSPSPLQVCNSVSSCVSFGGFRGHVLRKVSSLIKEQAAPESTSNTSDLPSIRSITWNLGTSAVVASLLSS